MFFAGLICLGGGAAVLPPAWTLGTEAVIALGLMAGGILLMVSGMIANIRMRTLSAVLAEAHRRELESESGTAPPASLGSRLMAPGAVSESVVEMAPFLEARNRQVHSMKPRATGLLLAFAALGGLLLILAAESFLGGDPGSGIGFALIGVLAAIIAGVWTLILYAPRLPTHPVQLRVDSRGVSLSRSRGPGTLVLWATPSLRLFLIDTRPSVRRPTSDGSPALFLYETTLGVVPLTVPGMDAVKQQAQQQGLQVDQLPQGSYGNLPLRRRMSLPFGSIVTVLSRQ